MNVNDSDGGSAKPNGGKIPLFNKLAKLVFGLTNWLVLTAPKVVVIAKERYTKEIFVNPGKSMTSLKVPINSVRYTIRESTVHLLVIEKGIITIIGEPRDNEQTKNTQSNVKV